MRFHEIGNIRKVVSLYYLLSIIRILLISNYLKREQLAKENQRKGKIRSASSTGAEFLVAVCFHFHQCGALQC